MMMVNGLMVSQKLIRRIIKGVAEAQNHYNSGNAPVVRQIDPNFQDFIAGPTPLTDSLNHVLGPLKSDFLSSCMDMVVYKVGQILDSNAKFHCIPDQMCMKFRVRRF